MAKRITDEDIVRINELYLKIGSYAGVARETGFAPSTVKKYVRQDFQPVAAEPAKTFTIDMISEDFYTDFLVGVDNLGMACVLSEIEKEAVKELWNELVL